MVKNVVIFVLMVVCVALGSFSYHASIELVKYSCAVEMLEHEKERDCKNDDYKNEEIKRLNDKISDLKNEVSKLKDRCDFMLDELFKEVDTAAGIAANDPIWVDSDRLEKAVVSTEEIEEVLRLMTEQPQD